MLFYGTHSWVCTVSHKGIILTSFLDRQHQSEAPTFWRASQQRCLGSGRTNIHHGMPRQGKESLPMEHQRRAHLRLGKSTSNTRLGRLREWTLFSCHGVWNSHLRVQLRHSRARVRTGFENETGLCEHKSKFEVFTSPQCSGRSSNDRSGHSRDRPYVQVWREGWIVCHQSCIWWCEWELCCDW